MWNSFLVTNCKLKEIQPKFIENKQTKFYLLVKLPLQYSQKLIAVHNVIWQPNVKGMLSCHMIEKNRSTEDIQRECYIFLHIYKNYSITDLKYTNGSKTA